MVAKIAIRVCPVPGCLTISSKDGVCPGHPNRALVREIYEHKPKAGAAKPGDLGGKRSPFGDFDLNNLNLDSMGDVLYGIFGGKKL